MRLAACVLAMIVFAGMLLGSAIAIVHLLR